jgi:hypothetical protein
MAMALLEFVACWRPARSRPSVLSQASSPDKFGEFDDYLFFSNSSHVFLFFP